MSSARPPIADIPAETHGNGLHSIAPHYANEMMKAEPKAPPSDLPVVCTENLDSDVVMMKSAKDRI
jgi:hypothetical protein